MKTWFTISNKAESSSAEIDIFDEIGMWGITVKSFADALASIPADRDITLRINSPGGIVTDGFAIFNLIRSRRERVTAHVIGLAASMATVVMLAAKRVTAAENATLMIHRPWGGAVGESEELRTMADLLDKLEGQLVNAYVEKTGKSEADVKSAMDSTTWFTAAEAKEWGLVDEVTPAMQAVASFDLTRFGKIPAAVAANAKQPAVRNEISGGQSASTNQPTQNEMKNLIKALVDAKLVASTDASEDTAVAQFGAAFAAVANTNKENAEKVADLEAKLKAANDTIVANAKSAAEASVETAVKAGKIKDDKEVRAKWVDLCVKDAAGTKTMIDALPSASPRGAAPLSAPQNSDKSNERPSTYSVWAKQFNK